MDYLVGYHPVWLDASLLPGPSLTDSLLAPRAALLTLDGDLTFREFEATGDPRDAIRILRLGESDEVPLSEGDADRVHAFLKDIRRAGLSDSDRPLAASVYATLAGASWMPPPLAEEYRVRAESLRPPSSKPPVPAEERPPEPSDADEAGLAEHLDELEVEAVAEELEIEPPPEEDLPPLPGTAADASRAPSEEPPTAPVPPVPTPPDDALGGLEREKADLVRQRAELEATQREAEVRRAEAEQAVHAAEEETTGESERVRRKLEEERRRMEKWVEQQSRVLEGNEAALAAKYTEIAAKEREIAERERTMSERDRELRSRELKREVVAFLEEIPRIDERVATVVAEAFPDLKALRSADIEALTQLKGVDEAIARTIRRVVAPEDVGEAPVNPRQVALLLMEERNYEGALRVYESLLRERPTEISFWFEKAELLVLLGRQEEAIDCYTRVLDLDRDNRQAWYEKANLFFGLGKLPEALDALRETLKRDKSKAQDLCLKAEQMRRDGNPNDAALLFQAVLDVDSEYTRAVLGLGDTLLDLGDVDAAEGLYTRALGKDPKSPRVLYRKGKMLDRKGRWGAALQLYSRALALDGKYIKPWLGKGDVLLQRGKPREALECFDKVLEFDPGNADAWVGKARGQRALGEKDAARGHLKRALELDPHNLDAKATLEALDSPTPENAATPPEPITAVEPQLESASVLVQLAELALEGGDAEMSLLRYTEAIQKNPGNADAWVGKGIALQNLERYREAVEAYDRGLAIRPDHELGRRWRESAVRRVGGQK